MPGVGTVRQRGEGVAIVLSGQAVSAWKAGSQWKAWSSRLVTATLKVGDRSGDKLHVLSCYAPTFAASRAEKDSFFACLQDALLSFPSDECFVILLMWAPELWMMNGGMRGAFTGMVSSMRLEGSCCLSSPLTRLLCVTPGSRRKISILAAS